MPLTDPLYTEQSDLARKLLGLYDPNVEEERRKKALGQMEDVIARRYARAGETGSSVEKDALQNAAKDFSLDWAERQPTQYAKAISGSQLPISNLLAGRTQDINKALSEGAITGYYGGQPTLARERAGEEFNLNQEKLQWLKDQSTQDLWGNFAGSLAQRSGLLDWLFPGGTGYGGGGGGPGYGLNTGNVPSLVNWLTGAKSLPDILSKGWDWITGAPAGGLGPITSTEWTNLVSQLGPISDVGDLMAGGYFPLVGSAPAATGVGAASGVNWTPELINALYGGAPPVAAAAGAGLAPIGAEIPELAIPAILPESGGLMSGLSSWLSGAGPWSAGIGLLSYLTNPQMSPIPGMRDTSDQDTARLAQQDAQQYMTRSPAQLEELVQAAANGDPGVNGRAVDLLPDPQYTAFKRRFWQAVRHEGEFAGHPSLSYPTQADQRIMESLAPWQIPGALTYEQMYSSAPPLFEPR